MFKFRNKTIEEFRDEALCYLGKEITLKNGAKWIVEEVTENDVRYISTMTGIFQFDSRGEFDWNKGVKPIKMFGFIVTLKQTDELGRSMSFPEQILVPFETKDEKQFLVVTREDSIIS
jgi:hypothetical protein